MGRALAVWTIEKHARDLIFHSPSAGLEPKYTPFAGELESMGYRVRHVRGVVRVRDDVSKADPSVLETAETANVLAVETCKKLFDLLLKPHEDLNTSWSLVDPGLDSLVDFLV